MLHGVKAYRISYPILAALFVHRDPCCSMEFNFDFLREICRRYTWDVAAVTSLA